MKKYILIISLLIGLGACAQKDQWYLLEDYSNVRKIDVHIHLESDRDLFVKKAVEDNFRLVNVALEYSDGWNDVYEKYGYGLVHHERFPDAVDMVTAFAVSDWDDEGWEQRVIAWMDSCFEQGALGVKVWKNIGMVSRDEKGDLISIDDSRFDPIFRHIRDRGKTLMGHLGEPKNCWLPLDSMTTTNDRRYFERHPEYYMFLQPDMPSYESLVEARDRMLAKNPDLRFVGAHLGSLEWSVDELALRLDQFPNMAVDLAARMGHLFHQTHQDREKVRDFFLKYQDRILYGTDLGDGGGQAEEDLYRGMSENWKRDWEYFVTDNVMNSSLVKNTFRGLKLPKDVVDKVFYKNAINWFAMEE